MQQPTATHENVLRSLLIVAMILFAAVIRIVPHPWNLTPVGAMALFSGAVIRNRLLAFVVPLLGLLAGDLFIGFHILMPVVYASFLVSIVIGWLLRERRSIPRYWRCGLAGSVAVFPDHQFRSVDDFEFLSHGLSPASRLATSLGCRCSGIRWRETRFSPHFSSAHFFWRNARYPAFRPDAVAAS